MPKKFREILNDIHLNQAGTHVDLSHRRLGNNDIIKLIEALRSNTTLISLDLSGNKIGEKGGRALLAFLETNRTIQAIRLEGNPLEDLESAIQSNLGEKAREREQQRLLEERERKEKTLADIFNQLQQGRLKALRIEAGAGRASPDVVGLLSCSLPITLHGHALPIMALAILPDGRIVSGSIDHTVRIWNPENGQCLATLQGHTDDVEAVAILNDGRIVSGSDDETLRIWNPENGQCLATLQGHTDEVEAVAILNDGRIVSGSIDHTVRI